MAPARSPGVRYGALADRRALEDGPLTGVYDDAWNSRQSTPVFRLS